MIEPVGQPPPLRPSAAARPRQGAPFEAGRFAIEADAGAAESVAGGAVAEAAVVSLGGLLAMQEAEAERPADREAKRRGEDLLRELALLQRDLLATGPSESGLARLAAVAGQAGEAARSGVDPSLLGVLNAIGVRAQVELARYRLDAERSGR